MLERTLSRRSTLCAHSRQGSRLWPAQSLPTRPSCGTHAREGDGQPVVPAGRPPLRRLRQHRSPRSWLSLPHRRQTGQAPADANGPRHFLAATPAPRGIAQVPRVRPTCAPEGSEAAKRQTGARGCRPGSLCSRPHLQRSEAPGAWRTLPIARQYNGALRSRKLLRSPATTLAPPFPAENCPSCGSSTSEARRLS